jgi:hypothetical protein
MHHGEPRTETGVVVASLVGPDARSLFNVPVASPLVVQAVSGSAQLARGLRTALSEDSINLI